MYNGSVYLGSLILNAILITVITYIALISSRNKFLAWIVILIFILLGIFWSFTSGGHSPKSTATDRVGPFYEKKDYTKPFYNCYLLEPCRFEAIPRNPIVSGINKSINTAIGTIPFFLLGTILGLSKIGKASLLKTLRFLLKR